ACIAESIKKPTVRLGKYRGRRSRRRRTKPRLLTAGRSNFRALSSAECSKCRLPLERLAAKSSTRKRPSTGATASLWERGDLHLCKMLAVSALLEIAAFLAVVDDSNFFGATLADEFGGDFCPINVRRPDFRRRAVVNKKYLVECERIAGFVGAFQFFD